jgi:hypothetical protein
VLYKEVWKYVGTGLESVIELGIVVSIYSALSSPFENIVISLLIFIYVASQQRVIGIAMLEQNLNRNWQYVRLLKTIKPQALEFIRHQESVDIIPESIHLCFAGRPAEAEGGRGV